MVTEEDQIRINRGCAEYLRARLENYATRHVLEDGYITGVDLPEDVLWDAVSDTLDQFMSVVLGRIQDTEVFFEW